MKPDKKMTAKEIAFSETDGSNLYDILLDMAQNSKAILDVCKTLKEAETSLSKKIDALNEIVKDNEKATEFELNLLKKRVFAKKNVKTDYDNLMKKDVLEKLSDILSIR